MQVLISHVSLASLDVLVFLLILEDDITYLIIWTTTEGCVGVPERCDWIVLLSD